MGNIAATRRKIQDILAGISGLTVKLGMYYPDDDESTTECFTIAKVNEPVLIICPGKMVDVRNFKQGVSSLIGFEVKLLLYFAYTNFEDFDYTELEDLLESILHELVDMDNWDDASAPWNIEPFEKKGEHKATPRIVMSEMKLEFVGSV